VELGGMDWTDPVQCVDRWRADVNCVMNLRVTHNAGNLQLFTVDIKIVCMAYELLLWHVGLLVYWICVIVQVQHINNRKYSNSYTINYEYRQTVVCIDNAV
jgi:hypothetical protein